MSTIQTSLEDEASKLTSQSSSAACTSNLSHLNSGTSTLPGLADNLMVTLPSTADVSIGMSTINHPSCPVDSSGSVEHQKEVSKHSASAPSASTSSSFNSVAQFSPEEPTGMSHQHSFHRDTSHDSCDTATQNSKLHSSSSERTCTFWQLFEEPFIFMDNKPANTDCSQSSASAHYSADENTVHSLKFAPEKSHQSTTGKDGSEKNATAFLSKHRMSGNTVAAPLKSAAATSTLKDAGLSHCNLNPKVMLAKMTEYQPTDFSKIFRILKCAARRKKCLERDKQFLTISGIRDAIRQNKGRSRLHKIHKVNCHTV